MYVYICEHVREREDSIYPRQYKIIISIHRSFPLKEINYLHIIILKFYRYIMQERNK